MSNNQPKILWFLLTTMAICDSAKLLLMPVNINSHVIFFSQLGTELADHGHVITMLISSNAKIPGWLDKTKLTIELYKVSEPTPFMSSEYSSETLVKIATSKSIMEWIPLTLEFNDKMINHLSKDCEALLEDNKLFDRLNQTQYDMAIVDAVGISCFFIYPYKLGIRHSVFSLPATPCLFGVPTLPSFVPSFAISHTDRMSFWQRVINLLRVIIQSYYIEHFECSSKAHVPNRTPQSCYQLWHNSELWFYLSDASLSYPSPLMPNTIEIGDIMARPASPLPLDLETFLNQSPDGVVLVSLGSFIDYIPDDIICKFATAFAKLQQNVIWKIKHLPTSCEFSGNVRAMTWVPQNDILAHKNLKLFITHCGLNSVLEGVYHAVPMLAFPLAFDQPQMALFLETRDLAIRINIQNFTSNDVLESMNQLLTNETYTDNIKETSHLLRNKSDKPGARASFWINHVIKHGSKHLRTSAFDLSLFQFFMADIFLFLLVMLLIAIAILMGCACMICKCAKGLCSKQGKLKTS